MKPSVLQIAFTYRQALTKRSKLQDNGAAFIRLEANQSLEKLQESKGCFERRV
jgi:hypothetical protein